MLGKPLEVLSFKEGRGGINAYLETADALPLRDYVPLVEGTLVDQVGRACCRGHLIRAEPDDDINYAVLALLLLEDKGTTFDTADIARSWLRLLPAGASWTAERAAYRVLLNNMADEFVNGEAAGFDITECSDNAFNEWIGAQIRADLYGWVCPGRPALAADMAMQDASLSHRGEGVNGAVFIAAFGATIPTVPTLDAAIHAALEYVPVGSEAAAAVRFGQSLPGSSNAVERLHKKYTGMSPVHTPHNLALVVWALCSARDNFGAAVGDAVTAGWDTDCNGATVGGLFGLTGAEIPGSWTQPWQGRIGVGLAGIAELELNDVAARTVEIAQSIRKFN